METALKNRKFILREIAPMEFLNNFIPRNEWHIHIDENIQVVTVNGDPSDCVMWDGTLRSLSWTNASAEEWNIMSGALAFDRAFNVCHGRVTSGASLSYLVESVHAGNVNFDFPSAENGILPFLSMESFEIAEPPPSYSRIEEPEIQFPSPDVKVAPEELVEKIPLDQVDDAGVSDGVTDGLEDSAAGAAALGGAAAAEEAPKEQVVVSKVMTMSYVTWKRETDDEDWEPSVEVRIGSELTTMLHSFIYFHKEEITQYVSIDKDGDHYVKHAQVTGDPCPFAFDITFTGGGKSRTFTGTLVNAKNKVFQWKGEFSTLTEVDREGSNQRSKGSDNQFLDTLLYGITSVSRSEIYDEKTKQLVSVDLAQEEADRIFGRLIFGSVPDDMSKMLFPGMFNLTPAEKETQKLGSEFLKRAGIHYVMANIKSSDQVKPKIKDKIRQDKCERFLPMCVAAGAAPADKSKDPVILYGLSREDEKDKALVHQLQGEAQAVSRACYLLGYRTVVTTIQPYLNNAGEWYNILSDTLSSSIFLADWQNKSSVSEGCAKTLYDLHTKLDVLWQAANENEEFRKRLPEKVKKPEEIISLVNGASWMKTLDSIAWDDTAKQNVRNFWKKLDTVQEDERTRQMVENFKKQMIVDQAKPQSFQTFGEYTIQLMDDLGKDGTRWSAREADARLAVLDAQQARANAIAEAGAAGVDAPAWYKGIPWREGFMSYIRSAVTVVALGGLTYLVTQNAGHMEWDEQVAMFGQLAEGFASVRTTLSKMTSVGAGAAMGVGAFLNKWFLTPLGNVCRVVGNWLYYSMGRLGKKIIDGIKGLLTKIKDLVAKGVEKIATGVGHAGSWLKAVGVKYGPTFNILAKCISFGVSAFCFWVALKACIEAWKHGRPVDIFMSTIGAALAGLEVLCLVIQGLGGLFNYSGAIVTICAGAGPILAAAGIVFAVVFIIVAFACAEDPLNDLVEKYGRMYGIVG